MQVNTYRNQEAARQALRTEDLTFIQVDIGESYVHKGIVAARQYGQGIYGVPSDDIPEFQEMYADLILNMAENNALPEAANVTGLQKLPPVDDMFAVIDEVEDGPFHSGVTPDSDPRVTINRSTAKLWAVAYETPCHDECPDNWIQHFHVAIYETSKAEAVRMLLTGNGD